MATIADTVHERSVSIGRVFGRGFGTLVTNPLATFGIAFLFSALPSLMLTYGIQAWGAEIISRLGIWSTVGAGLITVLIALALAMITQGALVRATVAHSEGRRAGLAESALAGLRLVIPLFLLALLSALGMVLGLMMLIVPGIILYVMWSVSAPALVEEGLGPFDALGRSRALTAGARWKIFGLLLVLVVGYWLFSAAIAAATMAIYGGVEGMANAMAPTGPMPIGYMILNTVAQTIVAAVWGVILTSLYVELRDWKDGPATETLAEVFR